MKPSLLMSYRKHKDAVEIQHKIFDSINETHKATGVHKRTISNSLHRGDWVKDGTYKFEWLVKKPTIGDKKSVIVEYLVDGQTWDTRVFGSLTLASRHTGISRNRIQQAVKSKDILIDDSYQQNQMAFRMNGDGGVEEADEREHICRYLAYQKENFGRDKIPLVELEQKGYIYTTYYDRLNVIEELKAEGLIECDGIVIINKQ